MSWKTSALVQKPVCFGPVAGRAVRGERFSTGPLAAIGGLLLIAIPALAAAQKLAARAVVEKSDVFVGEPFAFQIQVEGDESPEKPDLSAIRDFDVQFLGGRQNSSSSITIINGRMTQNVRRGYVFSYRLTPRAAGQLTIPSIQVKAGGRTAATLPVEIRASPPEETDEFKLRLELSDATCYVGQPITLTVVWYIGMDVEGFQFNVPVLSDSRFDSADVAMDQAPASSGEYLRIPLGNGEVIGRKGRDTLDGKDFLTVRFQKILIPKRAGVYRIPRATVACNAVTGYRDRRSSGGPDDFFDDFFRDDFFFGRRKQAVHKKFVVPSNEAALTVYDLPEEGKPAGFTGLVGRYSISATAAPTDVRVGDPITLTVKVTGPAYLENVELPPLERQPDLARDFKIPSERSPGKVEGGAKVFTQTLRAKNARVTRVPALQLPYFDAEQGRYAVARTEPIPLRVAPTRVVTAADAEGRPLAAAKSELESWASGIAHNYEDLSVLADQRAGPAAWAESPVWRAILLAPPLLYAALLGAVVSMRRRRADPAGRESRRAMGAFVREVREQKKAASSDAQERYARLLASLRRYLGRKLRLPPGSLTYRDVCEPLRERGAAEEDLEALRAIFEQCEAARYAGAAADDEGAVFLDAAIAAVRRVERALS